MVAVLARAETVMKITCAIPKSAYNAHRRTTGPEIWWQLQSGSLLPDAFVAGVGSGGTVMGVGRYLRSQAPSLRIHPLEPAESLTLSTGHKVGQHRNPPSSLATGTMWAPKL